jgi:hypothetical protein
VVLGNHNDGIPDPDDADVSSKPIAQSGNIHLTKAEGTVSLTNPDGKELSIIENMQLFSGNAVATGLESYAYLSLESLRAAKLDADSSVRVEQNKANLDLYLDQGNLFFNVQSSLKDNETLNIHTATMVVGIRGTSGVVVAKRKLPLSMYSTEKWSCQCSLRQSKSRQERSQKSST